MSQPGKRRLLSEDRERFLPASILRRCSASPQNDHLRGSTRASPSPQPSPLGRVSIVRQRIKNLAPAATSGAGKWSTLSSSRNDSVERSAALAFGLNVSGSNATRRADDRSPNSDWHLRCQTVPPLPEGEGRGEGEGTVRTPLFRLRERVGVRGNRSSECLTPLLHLDLDSGS